MKKVILLSVLILLICLAYAFAEVPCKINYQGRLIKDNVPVHNTAGIPMIFKLFDTATGTGGEKVVYSGNVPVYNGLFRAVLDLEGVNWTAGEAKYLQVIVDEEPLSPREELSAYPYAINSHLLEGATKEYFLNTSGEAQTKQGNLNIIGNVGIGTTSPEQKLHISGSSVPLLFDGGSRKWYVHQTGDLLIFAPRKDDDSGIDWSRELRLNGVNGQVSIDGNLGIGTTSPGTNKLEVVGGPIKATGGLIIETRTSDPTGPATGQMWLRGDINP